MGSEKPESWRDAGDAPRAPGAPTAARSPTAADHGPVAATPGPSPAADHGLVAATPGPSPAIGGGVRSVGRWLRPWPVVAAVAGGVLPGLCFAPFDQEWICWIGLTPLLAAVWFGVRPGRGASWRRAGLGYLAGVAFFLVSLRWLTTVHAAGWVALSLYLGLYFAGWAWAVGGLGGDRRFLRSGPNVGVAFLGAAAWVTLEWLRGELFTGFGWNALGVALHRNLLYIQIAEFTGVAGLSFLVVFCNLIAVITVRRLIAEAGGGRLRPHLDFTAAVALVGAVFLYGFAALVKFGGVGGSGGPGAGREIKVVAVQANIPQYQKWDAAFERQIEERYTALTDAGLALAPDLLLWPEAAIPRSMFADDEAFKFVTGFVAGRPTNFLLGTLDFDAAGDYNAAVMVNRGGAAVQIYRKLHLVPFGEFIPFRRTFPLFAAAAGDLVPTDFRPGERVEVLVCETPPLFVGPLICFEDTLGDLTRRFVIEGADVLVNVTNDGWFKESAGAEQHLANAVFRAVENRRPLLRAANTGVTCFIDPCGRVRQALRGPDGRPFVEGLLAGKIAVPERLPTTFYTRWGELFAHTMGAVTVLWGAVGGWRWLRRRRR